ncbi:PEP-CTERM sorting domain-containing protein [Marinobacter sp. ATCH36]|uniref:PEP-CTERM sorting domain-containing protein n=1 Tax=Marinobacter sp. ATCH36 TaxID=2945106 RepID=UPI002020AEEE|nr:PEP-CTERM sorting domain-containing protein [Marinobacter sp. ATCH36]MCL7945706.1 DUF4114 domain-containing protein [Marinobacter sp. ATCH36]
MNAVSKILATGILASTVGMAHAVPTDLADLKADDGTTTLFSQVAAGEYSDTGASYVELTDANSVNDDVTAFLLFEFAGFSEDNAFGIYDMNSFNPNDVGSTNILEIFSGSNSPTSDLTVSFDVNAGTAELNGTTANIGSYFGFYLERSGTRFYSDASLNSAGTDMALMYDVAGTQNQGMFGSDILVAFEDVLDGDMDFNDLVVGVSDVKVVSEPGTLALFSLGLLGFGLARRRNKA